MPDQFWFLGNANLGGAHLPVFFARSLARNLDAICGALEGRSDTEGGLLLYSGKAPSPHIIFPTPLCCRSDRRFLDRIEERNADPSLPQPDRFRAFA